MLKLQLITLCAFCVTLLHGQSISGEKIDLQYLKSPQVSLNSEMQNFKVTVTSPYNITADDIINQSKADFQKEMDNYSLLVVESERIYQQKLKEYDGEVKNAMTKFKTESEQFNKLSFIERGILTDQGKAPRLITPTRPEYYKPQQPEYRQPNLNNYVIINNDILSSMIDIKGLKRGNPDLDINTDFQRINFQDNTGKSYANQPTKLIVKLNGKETINRTFCNEYEFISSLPTNNINKPLEEKKYLENLIKKLNQVLNDTYGYQPIPKTIKILFVKNVKNKYDELEKAHIYVTTNLKKLLYITDLHAYQTTLEAMQRGVDIWIQTLSKIEYKNPKSDYNPNIAKYIYFNLLNLNLALENKKEAEKYLNQLQENLVDIKLSGDEQKQLKELEKEIYKLY